MDREGIHRHMKVCHHIFVHEADDDESRTHQGEYASSGKSLEKSLLDCSRSFMFLLRLEELGIDCRSGLYGPEHDFRLAVCLILTCAVHKPYNHHRQYYADSDRY